MNIQHCLSFCNASPGPFDQHHIGLFCIKVRNATLGSSDDPVLATCPSEEPSETLLTSWVRLRSYSGTPAFRRLSNKLFEVVLCMLTKRSRMKLIESAGWSCIAFSTAACASLFCPASANAAARCV